MRNLLEKYNELLKHVEFFHKKTNHLIPETANAFNELNNPTFHCLSGEYGIDLGNEIKNDDIPGIIIVDILYLFDQIEYESQLLIEDGQLKWEGEEKLRELNDRIETARSIIENFPDAEELKELMRQNQNIGEFKDCYGKLKKITERNRHENRKGNIRNEKGKY